MPDVVIMGVDAALFATGIGILKVNGDSFETMHTELIKIPFKKCLLRPWHFLNRTVHSHKIVRGLFLEKS